MDTIIITSREQETLETMSRMLSKEIELNFIKKLFRKETSLDTEKVNSFVYKLISKDAEKDPLFKTLISKMSYLEEKSLKSFLLENFKDSKKWSFYYKRCILEIFEDQQNYRKAF